MCKKLCNFCTLFAQLLCNFCTLLCNFCATCEQKKKQDHELKHTEHKQQQGRATSGRRVPKALFFPILGEVCDSKPLRKHLSPIKKLYWELLLPCSPKITDQHTDQHHQGRTRTGQQYLVGQNLPKIFRESQERLTFFFIGL